MAVLCSRCGRSSAVTGGRLHTQEFGRTVLQIGFHKVSVPSESSGRQCSQATVRSPSFIRPEQVDSKGALASSGPFTGLHSGSVATVSLFSYTASLLARVGPHVSGSSRSSLSAQASLVQPQRVCGSARAPFEGIFIAAGVITTPSRFLLQKI